MIPLHLTIEGLYSYREKQEIDFSRLTQAQLFGIFGATGSGKSSILEAISYALYGQSERLNQRDNRGYNMMNLKSNRLYIDFEFLVDEDKYKFTVLGKRNSKRFDTISSFERQAFKYEEGQPVPMQDLDAEAILGLSYDNFKRTVIIPQGKFQEFLQLSETDRTRMLKEIFKLEKYELYRKTASLEQKNNDQITRHETLLIQLESVNEETVRALQTDIGIRENHIVEQKKEQQKLERSLKELHELQQLIDKIEPQRKKVEELQAQAASFQEREQNLQQYEVCLIDFKPLLDKKTEQSEQLTQTSQKIVAKQQARDQALSDLKRSAETFEEIKKQYAQRDKFLQQAEEFNTVIQLKELESNLIALQARIAKGNEVIEKSRHDIEQMKLDLAAKSVQIRELRESRPDINRLMKIKEWYTRYEDLKKNTAQAEKQRTTLIEKQEKLAEEKLAVLKLTPLSQTQYQLPEEQLSTLLANRKQETDNQIHQLETERETILTQAQLSLLADKILEGDPCPLCGSTHHPEILRVKHSDRKVEEIRQNILKLRDQLQQLSQAQIRMELLQTQGHDLKSQLKLANKEFQTIGQALDTHEAAFAWTQYTMEDDSPVQLQLAEIERIDKQVDQLNHEWEAFETSIHKEEKKLNHYISELEKLKKQENALNLQLTAQLQGLKLVDYQQYKSTENLQLERLAIQQKEKYKGIGDLHQTSEKRIQQLRSNVDMLKGEIAELEKAEQQLTRSIAKINQQAQEKLLKSDFSAINIVEQILKQGLDVSAEKQHIHEFKQSLHAASSALADLESQIGGKILDLDQMEQLQNQLEKINQQISDQMIQIGGLKQALERMESDLKRKREIETQLNKLKLRAEDIRLLKNMFARSGFVNYVSSIFLQNLCLAANDRFRKLTRGSLSIEPTANNSFQVRDYLNNGKIRSVKTLSGGQTFQAALCLALALADQVQQQAASPQNFFFLDEGFGSLDKSSLQIVFQTLKTLRNERRIVGVISHVEELQEEIDTYLQIENKEENGSKIIPSWDI